MSSVKGQRLNPFQHARKRPDTYIGSCKNVNRDMWVFSISPNDEGIDADNDVDTEGSDTKPKKESLFVFKNIRYNAGLTRLFVEAMSNAIDNKWRSQENGVKMSNIKFTIDNNPESESYGWITVWNDGYCMEVHKKEFEYEDYRNKKTIKESVYPAEFYFGEMLAGTNFEDDDKRKTSGRNGMGAKAIVVFSKEFIIDHSNPDDKKKFYQKYYNAGKDRDEPIVESYKSKTGYTSVSFLPDYEYFG